MRTRRLMLAWPAMLLAVGCGAGSVSVGPSPDPGPGPGGGGSAVLVGAGDIAVCGEPAAEATAQVLDKVSGTVFTAGDNAYFQGTAEQFRDCYHPTWGRHKDRTRPAPGNHDYESPGAAPYFAYFGQAAGPRGLGYYSFTLGVWHVVSLNSNIAADSLSEQAQWLRDDLAATRATCVAAIFHHPLFSSGPSRGGAMKDIWKVLYQAGVEIVVNGHDHGYERFAPQDPDGRSDASRGIREFVVGSGGAPLYNFLAPRPNSEARISRFGVIRFTLSPQGYDWAFLEAPAGVVLDAGFGACH